MTRSTYWYFDRFGEPKDVMRQGRQDLPEPRPGQAVVAIRSVGLNQAEYRFLLGTHFPPDRFPACIGHEAVGVIVALGRETADAGPARWKVGDRVAFVPMLVDRVGMGTLRDVGVYDVASLLPVPKAYSDSEGAAFWMGVLTVGGALDMAGLGPETSDGKSVVITAAAGGMGIIGLKLARAWGAEAIATTRDPAKAERLAALASHVAVVKTVEDFASALQAVRPEGVDAVIDPLGGGFVGAAIEALVPGGQYVGYEMVAGATGSYDIMALLSRDASIHGYTIFRPLRRPGLLERLVGIGMDYADRLRPIVAETYSFARAPEAFAALARSEHVGKITITV